MVRKRTPRADKLAQIYDEEVLPLWSLRFGRMLLRKIPTPPPRSMILDVGCGTGYPSLELLPKLDGESRIIAIDSSTEMLNVARKKAGDLLGRRVFFRTETVSDRLPFASEVYDLVIANDSLWEMEDPEALICEFARVCKPGGTVGVTMPLQGSWGEFFDIYREVLIKHDHLDALERLDEEIRRLPEPDTARSWMENAGLREVNVESEEFELVFRSAREFFFAPVVEYGPLPQWKEIAGKGETMQEIFWHIKEAIDAYFADRAFSVTIRAGCLVGQKPASVAASDRDEALGRGRLESEAPAARPQRAEGGSAARAAQEADEVDEDAETGEIVEIGTGEIDVVEEANESLGLGKDEDPSSDDILKRE